jgi:GNAT superfamily N-acetyltransferase
MKRMKIFEVTQYSGKVLETLNNLLPQLSPSSLPLSSSDLLKIIQSESSHLLLAEKDDRYYGTLTLVMYTIPTGTKAWIEDVVVSEDTQSKGVGRMLLERAVFLAKELGANTVDLTSRPSREAANTLYKKVGFKPRQTNVYRYTY